MAHLDILVAFKVETVGRKLFGIDCSGDESSNDEAEVHCFLPTGLERAVVPDMGQTFARDLLMDLPASLHRIGFFETGLADYFVELGQAQTDRRLIKVADEIRSKTSLKNFGARSTSKDGTENFASGFDAKKSKESDDWDVTLDVGDSHEDHDTSRSLLGKYVKRTRTPELLVVANASNFGLVVEPSDLASIRDRYIGSALLQWLYDLLTAVDDEVAALVDRAFFFGHELTSRCTGTGPDHDGKL